MARGHSFDHNGPVIGGVAQGPQPTITWPTSTGAHDVPEGSNQDPVYLPEKKKNTRSVPAKKVAPAQPQQTTPETVPPDNDMIQKDTGYSKAVPIPKLDSVQEAARKRIENMPPTTRKNKDPFKFQDE